LFQALPLFFAPRTKQVVAKASSIVSEKERAFAAISRLWSWISWA
jgi:hypothetical protein